MCSRLDIILSPQYFEDVWNSNVDERTGNVDVYKPGSQVDGKLELLVVNPTECTGVYIDVRGMMFIGFNEGEHLKTYNHDAMLAGKQLKKHVVEQSIVILSRKQLFGAEEGQSRTLPPGEHKLPFRFDIPTDIPSSFDGGFGFIDYWIDAFIDQSHYGSGIRSRKKILIHGLYNLNAQPETMFPVEQFQEGTYCCLCCKNGNFSYSLVLPKRGYCHGESVQPTIELRNQTPANADASLKISKVVVYEVCNQWLRDEEGLIAESSVVISPQTTHQWRPVLLIKDQLPITKITQSSCIKVLYQLQLSFGTVECSIDRVEMKTDLTVGHYAQDHPSQSLPVMTQPQTYVYPSADFTTPQAEGNQSYPPSSSEKGGKPPNPGFHSPSQPTAPPVIHQPYFEPGPPDDDTPAPPSYSEYLAMTDVSGAQGPSAPLSEHQPDSTAEIIRTEDEENNRV